MAENNPKNVEFSRQIKVDALGEQTLSQSLLANEAERLALAGRFDLLDLSVLRAEVQVQRMAERSVIKVEGQFEAELSQACVVTLKPVAAALRGQFTRLYSLDPVLAQQEEVLVELEQEDPPDPVEDGRIDLGEAVAEELSLVITPYPRAEGADLAPYASGDKDEAASPFAVLEGLKLGR